MNPTLVQAAQAVLEAAVAPIAKWTAEHALSTNNELIASFPVLRHLKTFQLRQMRQALEALRKQLNRLEMRQGDLASVEFANMCYRYIEIGAKEHRHMKLHILAAACARIADADYDVPYDMQLDLFDLVEGLQPHHVEILKHLHDNYNEVVDGKCNHFKRPARFDDILAAKLPFPPPYEDFWLRKALIKLERDDLVAIVGGSGLRKNRDGEMEPWHYLDTSIREADIHLSPYGCRVFTHIQRAFDDDILSEEFISDSIEPAGTGINNQQ